MKKFYFVALAATVALSASAAHKQLPAKSRVASLKVAEKAMPALTKQAEAPARADESTTTDIAVTDMNIWSYYENAGQNAGEASEEIKIVYTDEEAGEVKITMEYFELVGKFDAATGALSIPNNQFLFTDSDGDVYFYLKSADASGNLNNGAISDEVVYGFLKGNTITFSPTVIWAIGDPAQENLGWYVLSSENEFYKDSWESLGMGSFLENILYSSFSEEENTTVTEVEVFSDGYGNYKITDPFQALYQKLNIGQYKSPTMVLNAQDPNDIIIPMTDSGLGNSSQGSYIYFSYSYYLGETGGSRNDATAITKTVDGDQVTIKFPVKSCLVWPTSTQQYYYACGYESTLTFTEKSDTESVESIGTASQTPARFYNLQGVALSNPQPGTFVIRVQDGKATKEIMK